MKTVTIAPRADGGKIIFEMSEPVSRLALTPEEWERLKAAGDDLREILAFRLPAEAGPAAQPPG